MTSFVSARLSRRRFLGTAAVTAGTLAGVGTLLDACSSGGPGPTSSGPTTLTIMGTSGEITPAYIKEFEKLNPGVKINFLTSDQTRLNAMFAAGHPPDIIRGFGIDSAFYNSRGLALNLDPYLAKSSVLKTDDLLPIQNLFRWDGKQTGQGPHYGLVKDWSLDGAIWADSAIFQQAGVPVPSSTNPLTYDAYLELGKKLTVRQGGKIQVYGIYPGWPSAGSYGTGVPAAPAIYQMVQQQGGSVFSSDLTKADFTTPEVFKALQWYIDYANAHVGPSPLDPDATGSWQLYTAKRMALLQLGYWFGGGITSDTGPNAATLQKASVLLPAPQMGPHRISSTFAGTGYWIAAKSQHPDVAWKFMEYFMTGTPATDRATSGWGIPALKQFVSLMPQKTDMQKEAFQEVQSEIQYFAPLRVSPYVGIAAVDTILGQALQQVLHNQLTLPAAAKQITDNVNLLMQQSQQAVG